MPLLFSYGTLQQEAVQLATFGRLLRGSPDELVGFEEGVREVTDAELADADRYEPEGWTRMAAPLASGRQAWVFGEARS